jgi:rSAM/selenodomain-associated transferase 1
MQPVNSQVKTRSASHRALSGAIAVFARTPIPGHTKTRLIPFLGGHGAAELQASLLRDSLRKVLALPPNLTRYLFVAGRRSSLLSIESLLERLGQEQSGRHPPRGRIRVIRQRGADLGKRLDLAFRILLRQHAKVVIIGTDSPLLAPGHLRLAFRELRVVESVLGPCPDGGYYLIGLRQISRGLFGGVRWSSSFAFRDTLRNILRQGWSCAVLPLVQDVDHPPDLKRLETELKRSKSARRLAPATWRFLRSRHNLADRVD